MSDRANMIWVDADACPVVIKEILYRAAERQQVQVTLVANQSLRIPQSKYLTALQVPQGFDVADNEIVKRMQSGDLVITGDIPLADQAISQGGLALSPRGEAFTPNSIKSRLAMRDFMETMRESGVDTGGPAALSQRDRKKFAEKLELWMRHGRL